MPIKKVLFLSAWYPTKFDSMGGLFVMRHAEVLSDRFDTNVLYTQAIQDNQIRYCPEITNENNVFTVRVYYRKVTNPIPGINHFLKFWRLFRAHYIGFRLIKKQKGLPDFVHLNILTRVGIFALYLRFRYGVPYVITEHWSRYLAERGDYKGFIRKVATKCIVRKSSGISTVSEKLKEAMIICGLQHKNFFVIRNVVDTQFFHPYITDRLSTQTKIFSHISCFDNRAKNTNGIVRAIASLSKQRSDFMCLMVGDGPDKSEAENLANQLGIKDKTIIFTGLKEDNDLVEIYNQSVFTFLFSNYENMPVVISESFACGKPVISTNVGGIPEIVNNSNGILITPGNEEALKDAINFMLDNYTKFDPSVIRNFALEQFGKEAILNQLLTLYQTAQQ